MFLGEGGGITFTVQRGHRSRAPGCLGSQGRKRGETANGDGDDESPASRRARCRELIQPADFVRLARPMPCGVRRPGLVCHLARVRALMPPSGCPENPELTRSRRPS